MVIYCISGLGADERAFVNLKPGRSLVHLPWPPINNSSSIEEYAKLFVPKINRNEPFALLGLSFGGMVAAELSKFVNPKLLILISTIKTAKELPWYFKLAGLFKLQFLIPSYFFAKDSIASRYILGVKTKEATTIYRELIKDADSKYYKKAVQLILKWEPKHHPQSFRIHGDNDKLLPVPKANVQHYIKGGGHLMIIDRGPEISKIIQKELSC